MKTMQVGIAILMTLSLSSCQTMDTNSGSSSSRLPWGMARFSVDIVSDPAGAVIEVNDNYVGKAPLTVELEGWTRTRTFARSHTIVAHPVQDGGQTQVKVFSGWYEASREYGDPIPEKIYFNMSLVRVPRQYDININE